MKGAHAKVAIVGGGLGGLTLARILQVHRIPTIVFEREPSPTARPQGGTLDMHPESGQRALREAGLELAFRAIARAEGQDMRIADKTGAILWDEVSAPDAMTRPEVDRAALRALLLDSLERDTIRWGHNLERVEGSTHGPPSLIFDNGVTETADVVVGADGASSRIRRHLTDAEPKHAGVDFIEVGIPAGKHTEIGAIVGRGSLFALGDDKGIIAQRNGDGRIRVYVAYRPGESGFNSGADIPPEPGAAKAAILDLFSDWSPRITALIAASDESVVHRPIHALPIGLRWPSRPGVTLVGDAAHLMSPFAGEGANLAMLDAAELAAELAHDADPDAAIAAYEGRMFERAESAARQSAKGLETCIASDGARRMAEQMAAYRRGS